MIGADVAPPIAPAAREWESVFLAEAQVLPPVNFEAEHIEYAEYAGYAEYAKQMPILATQPAAKSNSLDDLADLLSRHPWPAEFSSEAVNILRDAVPSTGFRPNAFQDVAAGKVAEVLASTRVALAARSLLDLAKGSAAGEGLAAGYLARTMLLSPSIIFVLPLIPLMDSLVSPERWGELLSLQGSSLWVLASWEARGRKP